MKKKFLALVLALVMTLTLLPVTAMADGGGASTTYTVTFDANGATGPVPTQAATAEGGKFKLPGAGDLEMSGYTFYGWSDGTNTYQKGATYRMPAEDVTFTAQWKRKPSLSLNSFNVLDNIRTGERTIEIYYTITNRNAEEMTYDIWWRLATDENDAIVTDKGAIVTLSANETRDEKLSATIPVDKANAVIANAEQLRLHVRKEGSSKGSSDLVYRVEYTVQDNIHSGYDVTLDNNGGLYDGKDTDPVIFIYSGGIIDGVNKNLYSRDGYSFLGFAKDPNATTPEYTIETLASVGDNIVTLYAVWTPNQVSTLPAQGAKYFVEHYVEKWDGSYKLVETEILSGEIGTIVTADSTKYDDNTHRVNTTASILNGIVTFDLSAADPMSSLLTLKVYYDMSPYYGSVDTTPETEIVTPKTADAGILLAVSMSILSVTGSAVLLKKKED